MGRLHSVLMGAVIAAPVVLLAASGIIHFQDGRSTDASYPVPLDQSVDVRVPPSAYADAAEALRHANPYNGAAQISRAEAEFNIGRTPHSLDDIVESGLMSDPASAEGWAFYAQILENVDKQKATQALNEAFLLAPYDFFLAGLRAQLASRLWNTLSGDTKDKALLQTRMLWDEPLLRDQLLNLLATSDGGRLVDRAFATDPSALRAINRWASARRRQLKFMGP